MSETTLWRLGYGSQTFEALVTDSGTIISRCGPAPVFFHEHERPALAISSAILYARFHTGDPGLGDEGFPPRGAMFWDLRTVERYGEEWSDEKATLSLSAFEDCLDVETFPSDDEIYEAHRSLDWLAGREAIERVERLHDLLRESYSEMILPARHTLKEVSDLLRIGLAALAGNRDQPAPRT